MPSISLHDQKILVSLQDLNSSDIDFETNLYFKGVAAKYDEKTNIFTFEKPPSISLLHKILSDTKEFFDSKGWKTSFDENCTKLLTKHSKETLDLESLKQIGLQIKESKDIELTLPSNFKRTLYDYQKKSVKHLAEIGNAANFSVPGSGKTTLSYAAYSILKSKGIVEKILVVSPRAAFVPWEEEFEGCFGFAPDRIRLEGSRVDEDILSDTKNKELVLSTYQLPLNHSLAVSKFLDKYKVLMILDESHNIKKMDGKVANALVDLASYATRRFILSGTPMPNSWEDIWTQFNFLWPLNDILDRSYLFRDYTKLKNNLGKYYDRINPLFTRIAKKTLGLKEPKYEKLIHPMRPIQRRIYNAIELKIKQEIENLHEETLDEGVRMGKWRKARMIRLIQTASNPALLNKPDTEFELDPISSEGLDISELIENYTKYEEIPSKIQEGTRKALELLNQGEKVIIWTNFVHNIDMLKNQLLKDVNPLWVDGRVPKDESEDYEFNREKMIQDFKSDPNPRVFIATPASCAESVSLHMYQGKTVCKHAIYIDRTYNAGQYMQSLDRIHRIGMHPDTLVTYWLCVAQNSYDEKIDSKLGRKIDNMYDLLNEDLRVIDLDVNETHVSKEEIEENYDALVDYLKNKRENAN